MRSRCVNHQWFGIFASGLALLALSSAPAQAQFRVFHPCCPICPIYPEPKAEPTRPEAPPTPDMAAEPPPGPVTAAAFAPNMLGNFMGPGKSISFFVARTDIGAYLAGSVTTNNFAYSKVADNNSPIPQDRVGFRYNYYNRALAVSGISNGPPRFDPAFQANFETPATKNYDVNMFTFDLEKTFFDGLMSVQVRIPFANTLSSNLNLNYGIINPARPTIPGTDIFGNPILDQFGDQISVLNVIRTPDQSLGSDATEFGNIQLILKALLYSAPRFAFSGGVSLGIPTGPDTHVRVIDYTGTFFYNNAEEQRLREFHIDNNTWSLSPFLAFVAAPNERWFTQGFLQMDFPLNSSRVHFRETLPVVRPEDDPSLNYPGTTFPIDQQARIRDQILMQVDLGTGFWLVRNPGARWLTGIAPTVELHYATTLNEADIITLPGDNSSHPVVPSATIASPRIAQVTNPAPLVGNLSNRMDIFDITVGTTFEIAARSTLAIGVALPLRGGDNRTFDWELQLQYNLYFGGPRPRAPYMQ